MCVRERDRQMCFDFAQARTRRERKFRNVRIFRRCHIATIHHEAHALARSPGGASAGGRMFSRRDLWRILELCTLHQHNVRSAAAGL